MLTTKDGAEVIIPNGDILSGQIVNWTLMNNQRRITTELEVRGSDDMELVATLIKKSIADSQFIVKGREPQVLFTKVYDDGFSLNLIYWCTDVAKSEEARNEIFMLLKKGLASNNLKLE
jgi:small-conductance mechanosensitive channel